MSRQMKTQTRKRKSSRIDKNACLLVIILIFSGILTFLLLTASDNRRLNSTLNETFDFVKTRIERYEIYNTNDQVKSLVRLLDKTTELSRVIAQEGNLSAEMLDEYAREQRLTGILVLDQNLKVTEQSAKDGDTMSLWQKLIKSDYFSEQTGNDVYLKPENMQLTGAYKIRGAYYKISTLSEEEKAKGLITASAGNHAQDPTFRKYFPTKHKIPARIEPVFVSFCLRAADPQANVPLATSPRPLSTPIAPSTAIRMIAST